MKILFVSSGNSTQDISPIVKSQAESIKKTGLSLDYFPVYGKGLSSYLKHIFLLRRHLYSGEYDLIHAHYGLCGIVAHLARRNEKLIVSFMGDDLIGEINKKGKYSLFGSILVLLNKIFYKMYDYVIVKSKELESHIKHNNNAVIPNGVYLNKFYPIEKQEARSILSINKDAKIVLFVGDINREEKNFRLAAEATVLCGDNSVQLTPVFSIEHEKLKNYYNAADVLILTSFHEGSPNVIKEAMACNCPIVSTDVGDVKWVFGNSEGCYLTSFKPEDVAQKIKFALEFSEKVGRTKGRERIIELGLDSETIAKRIIKIYSRVTANN